MEVAEEDTGSQLKDVQIGHSWIPATPLKPDSTKQQPICTTWQENNTPANPVTQANLSGTGRLPGDFMQETPCQKAPACRSSTHLIPVSSSSDNWRADEANKSHISGDNLFNFNTWHEVEVVKSYAYGEDLCAYEKPPMEKLCNMSFKNLLALAHAGSNRAAVENALTHTDFIATSSTSVPHFHPQIGGSQFTISYGNSPLQNLDSSPGAKFDAELNIENACTGASLPGFIIDGSSIPSRPFFDLNSSPRRTTDGASSKSTLSFEPITPEKTNKTEDRQDSAMRELCIDEVPAQRDIQEKKITKGGVLELHETKEKSHLIIDQLCAVTSVQLQENHKPDKGGTEEILLIKTPQQKPRRKKHRPKVIIEGQQKSTTKSSVGKPAVPEETPRVKRRYVRRKGVNNPLGGETNGTDLNNSTPSSIDTPARKRRYVRRKETDNSEGNMDKGTTETTEIKAPGHTQSSCRRSLNFNSEGLAGNECSSYCPSSNCNRELQAENFNETDQSRITQYNKEMEVMMEKNETGISHELTHSMNQVADLQASFQQDTPSTDQLKDEHNMFLDQNTRTRGKCQIVFSDVTHDKEANIVRVRMNSDYQRTQKSTSDSICSSTCLTPERQVRGLKRQNMSTSVDPELPNRNEIGAFYNSLQAYLPIFSQNANKNEATPGLHFPVIYKKKRTEKGHSMVTSSSQYIESNSNNHVKHALKDSCSKLFIATTNQGSYGVQYEVSNLLSTNRATDITQNGRQIFEHLLALGPTEKIKKRRSKGNTRLRDLASLLEICKELPASTSRIKQNAEILHEPHTCMEALVADTRSIMTTKKRSRRSLLSNSTVQKMHNRQKSTISIGKPLALSWKSMTPIDSLIEQLNQLDLNAQSSHALAQTQNAFMTFHTQYQEQALIPFQRCGDVVPFDNSFAQVRRRKPRPKVDLDDETTRVWKLLLENINNEGIDGTDEEKTKWWEEERRVFCGRADSFIARMRLVQGDRRFSPWKGSVVDSVVGVFLTQNVSDHLSSSAFMSLAARFPIKSKTSYAELHEEILGTNREETEVFVLDSDRSFGLNKEILNQSVHGEDTKMLQDFEDDSIREVNSVKPSRNSFDGFIPKDNLSGQSSDTFTQGPFVSHEAVTNKSTSLIDDGRDAEETLSSQTPEISSQNSADSPVAQTTERSDSCLLSASEEEPAARVKPNRLASSTSFVKLLRMAGTVLQGDYRNSNDNKMSDQNQQMLSESSTINLQNEDHLDNPTFPADTITLCRKSTCCHVPNFEAQATERDLSQKITKFSEKELCAAETSELSSESASENSIQNIKAVSFAEEPKASSPNAHSSNNDQIDIHQKRVADQTGQISEQSLVQENNYKMQEVSEIPIYSQNLMDITGSSSNIDNSKNLEHREVNSKNEPAYHSGNMVNGPKAKGGRTRKEKGDPVDWDNLRKGVQAGGREREKTANTMDSVDWDAVRCADVNDIAQTIKERGMNNMLAERIKEFLNRLVRDHGSVDLEWLRDVPPDKAKEYLLSIRGLGLKSVECVRLLTLHHLAFPVDTNVGRIAVRLGWVPLQPLPESLQLHLLELYPVLESIQKYLWPRLCKLDQRTLYELHYQMITFGKVFCTKSKPNCNACPLRAECRHFASAFASARLALPAPDEKSIVSATENRTADQDPTGSINTLQLPSPQANQMDISCGAGSSRPIIEEPPSPEPIIEVPATPELGYTQVSECNIESAQNEDPDEIPTIQLNMEQFTHNLQKIMQLNTELQESDMSKALVALTPEAASIPVPKLKNVSRLRTEHRVYELPDSHPLLEGLDKREPDDPCPYLLAIWTPGETVNSIEPPAKRCSSQGSENLCTDETCSSCNSIREANSQTVRGTILIPCRTAMRGSFPLNGTYFQVNEVFSDHESSLSPMDVPREWLWNLRRRTVFFGTSIPTIFKGLSTEGIQYCFWRGFVCVRGFDRKTRAPRPLTARLHFPGSKLAKGKGKGKIYDNE